MKALPTMVDGEDVDRLFELIFGRAVGDDLFKNSVVANRPTAEQIMAIEA